MSLRALAGIRVLDLSQYLPGPHATQILADLGAEVVKVEPPRGDPLRFMPPLDGDRIAAFYKLVNAGKTVIRLDLKTAAGQAAFRRLASRADALVESFRPGALARLGFGAEALRALNPALVHCALSGYGQTGPYARKAGHDLNYMALSGGLAISGTAERPVMAYPPTADFAGAMQAALCVVVALLGRERSGQGAFIDLGLSETVLAWQGMALTAAQRPGQAPARGAGLLNGGAACYQIYRTADRRFVTLGALEPDFWANFCRAVGKEDWIARQWEAMPQTDLIGAVAALMGSRTLPIWARDLEPVDCCFQPVLEPAEVPEDSHFRARGLVRRETGGDPLVQVLFPALFDGQAPVPRPPLAEGDAEAVLRAWEAPRTDSAE